MRIELSHLRKTFDHAVALRDVSLTIESGQKVALVGPNGSGKSTLIRVLMGLVDFEGDALLDGLHPMRDRAKLAPRMAYVPQIAPRLAASVGEVIEAIASVRDIEPKKVYEVADKLLLDTRTIQDKPFRDLSGGMKQKILIALAIAEPASLYILDEPTASLDSDSRDKFFELFDERCGDATLILCSHRVDEMEHMVDRVVVLADGMVAREKSIDEVTRASEKEKTPSSSPKLAKVIPFGGHHG